jgi:hypothetical protein
MKPSIIITTALIALFAAPASGGRDRAIPDAKPVGAAVSCIPLNQIRESRVRSDKIIDFRVSGKRWYRNTLPQSCPSLGFEERFGYATSLSELCSVDIITVLYATPVSRGASCGLGKFQPVELSTTR